MNIDLFLSRTRKVADALRAKDVSVLVRGNLGSRAYTALANLIVPGIDGRPSPWVADITTSYGRSYCMRVRCRDCGATYRIASRAHQHAHIRKHEEAQS